MDIKKCNTCKKVKELGQFYQNGRGKRRPRCKSCESLEPRYVNRYVGYDNKEAKKERREHAMVVKYGEGVAEILLHEQDCDVDIMRELNGY